MKKLHKSIEQLKGFIPQYDIINTSQSAGSIGWHVQHSFLVINQVCDALLHCNVSAYRKKRSLLKSIILMFGIIPRGKVKSPESVKPVGAITQDLLEVGAVDTEKLLARISKLSNDAYFKHPMFGHIKLRPAIRFLSVHTHHHLKIIMDIAGKKSEE